MCCLQIIIDQKDEMSQGKNRGRKKNSMERDEPVYESLDNYHDSQSVIDDEGCTDES